MICAICQLELDECICPDIDQRLASMRNDKVFIYKMCRTCGKHYMRCKCKVKDWTTSHEGVEMADVEKMQTLGDLLKEEHKRNDGEMDK